LSCASSSARTARKEPERGVGEPGFGMTIRDYLKLLWVQRALFSGVTVVTIVIATILVTLMPPRYSATAHLYFVAKGGQNFSDLASGQDLAVRMMPTYTELATSEFVLDPVVKPFNMATTMLRGELSITVPQATSDMYITVNETSGERAASLANAVAQQLSASMQTFSASLPSGARTIVAESVGAALPPSSKSALKTPAVLAGILLVGLLMGSAAAAARHLAGRKIRSTLDIPNDPASPLRGLNLGTADYLNGVRAIRNALGSAGEPARRVLIVSDGESAVGSLFVDDLAQAYAGAHRRALVVSTAITRTRPRPVRVHVPNHSVAVTDSTPDTDGTPDTDSTPDTDTTADAHATKGPNLPAAPEMISGDPPPKSPPATLVGLTLSQLLDGPTTPLPESVAIHGRRAYAPMRIDAGTSMVAVADLLARPEWNQLLDAAAKQFDVLLIHAPTAADGPAELGLALIGCDAAVVTVDYGRSRRDRIARSLEVLEQAGVPTISVLLNQKRPGRHKRR